MLMNERSRYAWGHLTALRDKNDTKSKPIGFLWFYDSAYPNTEAIQNTIQSIVNEKGNWTGDELSNAISRRWIPCACKFLPFDGGDFYDVYDLDLDSYIGAIRE